MEIGSILCPVELTLNSEKALRYAAGLARAYEAKLYVLTCTEALAPAGTPPRLEAGAEVRQTMERSLRQYVDDADLGGIAWESLLVEGSNPAEAITREAAARGVHLIVMCSRRRPLRAAILGSTAEEVYRTAPCPTLIMHPDEREWDESVPDNLRPARVLVAHDFSDYSELALRYALSFAQEYQAELHLLHVLSTPVLTEPELAWGPSGVEGVYQKAALSLKRSVPAEAYAWCRVTTAVRWGRPYREILTYAAEQNIDLISLGARGSNFGAYALLGSNVDRVLRQAPCPVLVARPLKPAQKGAA
jgi:nucleotide-binding universal stress UspA family protein